MCVRRGLATAATAADGRVAGIADQIGQLTLLETAELVSQLRVSFRRRRAGGR